jgi:hypothetical protein
MSMGTHVSLLAKEKFDFIVAEGFYHDAQKVVDRIQINKGEKALIPAKTKAIKKLNNKIPILIFCADNDKTTTLGDAKEFSKKNNVTIIEFKGDHLSESSTKSR